MCAFLNRMVRTPNQALDEIELLSQAIGELSSAVRERTQSETGSTRATPPPPSNVPNMTGPLRRLTPGERVLEKTKGEIRSSLDERTAARIAQLRGSDERRRASDARESSGGRPSASPSPLTMQQQGGSRALDFGSSDRNPLISSERVSSENVLKKEFPSAVKRNITVRKSRGHRSEPTGKLPQELISKRPTGRTRDHQYRREGGVSKAMDMNPRLKESTFAPMEDSNQDSNPFL